MKLKGNQAHFSKSFEQAGDFTDSLDINLKLASYPTLNGCSGSSQRNSLVLLTPLKKNQNLQKAKSLGRNRTPFEKAGELWFIWHRRGEQVQILIP